MTDTTAAPTSDELRAVIDSAEKVFRECHAFFGGDIGPDMRETVLAFQPRLARAIYSLEAEILRVKRAERTLAKSKGDHPKESLPGKFRQLHDFITGLERVIDYGFLVGDAFAWMFYRGESQLLSKHFGHQRISHLPVGIGGLGEIEFVAQSPVIGDHLVLYHGTTTFLRLGDVSFFNFRTKRIDGIAELKTRPLADKQVQIAVNYIGQKLDIPISTKVLSNPPPVPRLGQKFQSIIERQMKGIRRAVAQRPAKKSSLNADVAKLVFSPGCLVDLFDAASVKKASVMQVSPGLVLAGVKVEKSSLADRVLDSSPWQSKDSLDGVVLELRKLVVPGASDNSIQIGCLVFPNGGRYSLEYGMKPVPWWGIRRDVRDAIMDGTFMVMSFFNAAPLCGQLRNRGYEVNCRRPGRGFSLNADINGRKFPFLGLDHLFQLIPTRLIEEDSVFNVICRMVGNVALKHPDANGLVRLELQYHDTEAGEDLASDAIAQGETKE